MIKKIIFIFLLFGTLSAFDKIDKLPNGWQQHNLKEYGSGIAKIDNNNYGLLYNTSENPKHKGSIGQVFTPPFDWLQSRYRFSTYMSGNLMKGKAAFSVMCSAPHGRRVYAIARMKGIKEGFSPMQKYDVVIDIPFETAIFQMSLMLKGTGNVIFGKFNFEKVDYDVEVTHKDIEKGYDAPQNLEFQPQGGS